MERVWRRGCLKCWMSVFGRIVSTIAEEPPDGEDDEDQATDE
jgi:hypothetical protein